MKPFVGNDITHEIRSADSNCGRVESLATQKAAATRKQGRIEAIIAHAFIIVYMGCYSFMRKYVRVHEIDVPIVRKTTNCNSLNNKNLCVFE